MPPGNFHSIRDTTKGGGAAGVATLGAAGVEVTQSVLAETQSPTRKELSGFSWLWFCPVARLNGATHALD